jgi:hypothetical protein
MVIVVQIEKENTILFQSIFFLELTMVNNDCWCRYLLTAKTPMIAKTNEIRIKKSLPNLVIDFWSELSLDSDAVLSFPDEVIRIEACNNCQSAIKFGFSDLMAGQGTCAECKIELDVNLSKKIAFNDFNPDLRINKAFWPRSFVVDIATKSEQFRVSFEEGN